MTTSPLSDNQKRLIELAYSRTCQRLDAQQEIASASDQRALVFSTLSIAGSALVFGSLESASELFYAVGAAIFFGISAVSSALSAMPQAQYSTGSQAQELEDLIRSDVNEHSVLRGLCRNNDDYIDFNDSKARVRSHFYRFAICTFVIATLISAIGFVNVDPDSLELGEIQ